LCNTKSSDNYVNAKSSALLFKMLPLFQMDSQTCRKMMWDFINCMLYF